METERLILRPMTAADAQAAYENRTSDPASGKVMMKVGFQYQTDGVYYSFDRKKSFECKEYLLTI